MAIHYLLYAKFIWIHIRLNFLMIPSFSQNSRCKNDHYCSMRHTVCHHESSFLVFRPIIAQSRTHWNTGIWNSLNFDWNIFLNYKNLFGTICKKDIQKYHILFPWDTSQFLLQESIFCEYSRLYFSNPRLKDFVDIVIWERKE